MATPAEERKFDLRWIEDHMGINPLTTSKAEAHKILRDHEINTTSWVLSRLEKEYGKKWADLYRQSIANKTCAHGFLGNCPYCKWGTD